MRLWICASVICCAAYTSAQDVQQCPWSISGIVLDEHDDASLGYATIYIKELERGVVSDRTGRFLIEAICEGTYTLQFSHIGCESKEQVIRVRGHLNVTLHLEHHAELLETIELNARRIREAGSVARAELDSRTLLRSSGRSLGETLQHLPGVTTLQTGPTIFKPVIHGLHSNRLLILKDGLRLESQQWGLDHAPEIDPNSAAMISVVKGAAAVQYGADAVAGVILVESAGLPTDRSTHGDVRLTGVDNGRQGAVSASLTKGLGRGFGFRVNAGVRRAGDARAAKYFLTNTGLSELHGIVDIGYQKGLKSLRLSYQMFRSELGILRSAHIGNLTDLLDALERDRPLVIEDFSYEIQNPKQQVLHQTLRLAGQTHFEHLGILIAQYAIQWNAREEFDIRRGSRDDIPALDLQLQSHTGLLSLAHLNVGRIGGKVSLHWNFQQNTNVPGTGVRPLIPNYTKYAPAISWVEKWISDELEIEAGLRYEYVSLHVKRIDVQNMLVKPEFQFHNLSASAGLRFALSESIEGFSHLGGTHRAPHVNELFSEGLHHGAAAIEEGDTNLITEKAIKWVTGIEVRRSKWQLDGSVFLQYIDDFIYLQPTGEPRLTIRGAFPIFQYIQDDVRLMGSEVALQFPVINTLQWRSEFSMVRATLTDSKDDLIGIPSDRMRHAVIWNAKEKAVDVEVSVEHVWKQTRAPKDVDYAEPPDGYTLLNVSAGTDLIRERLHLHITARNMLNVSYREYLNRLRYYADDTGRSLELRLHYVF